MRRRLLVLLALLVGGCSPGAPSLSNGAAPVGTEAYRELLRREAGVVAGPRELAALAAADSGWIAERMGALAARIEPAGSATRPGGGAAWRAAFEPVRADRPDGPEGVLEAYREEVERARRFVLERRLVTLPPGPLEVTGTPDFLAERYPLTAYLGYRLGVTVGDGARLSDHCRACIPPLAVHETFPGHHTAFLHQRSGTGASEISPDLLKRSGAHLKNRFFHEGWAQYAEVLMLEGGYYAGEPERELGAWRSLLFRVERARLDALLHAGDLSPEEAVAELSVFVARETAQAEVRRHLEEPTLKAAYYVGLLQVLELRAAVRSADPAFDLRAFHDRLVRWPLPIPEAARERFGVAIGPDLPEEGLRAFFHTPAPGAASRTLPHAEP